MSRKFFCMSDWRFGWQRLARLAGVVAAVLQSQSTDNNNPLD
jgi:hypothetical protein